jgi:hypothetical protein
VVQRAAASLPDEIAEGIGAEWLAELEAMKDRPGSAFRFARGLGAAARCIADDRMSGLLEARATSTNPARVYIGGSRGRPRLVIEVRDAGVGMSLQELEAALQGFVSHKIEQRQFEVAAGAHQLLKRVRAGDFPEGPTTRVEMLLSDDEPRDLY